MTLGHYPCLDTCPDRSSRAHVVVVGGGLSLVRARPCVAPARYGRALPTLPWLLLPAAPVPIGRGLLAPEFPKRTLWSGRTSSALPNLPNFPGGRTVTEHALRPTDRPSSEPLLHLHCSHNPAGQGASSAPHGRWGGSHAGRCSERLARGARLARKQPQGPSTGTDDSGRAQCPEESQTAVPALARTPPFGAALFTRAEGWARL